MKYIKWLDDHIEELLLIIFSIIMVFIIALQVFMRFIINSSLPWSEELARYCFIWLIYIGISYGVKSQRHIKVDIALMFLKDKAKVMLNIISNIFFLTFAVFVVIYGFDVAKSLLQFGQKSSSLSMPMGIVYMATPIGMGLTAIRIVQQLIKQIKTVLGHGEFIVKTEKEIIIEDEIDKN